ncbi:nonribosomal peptide synthetase 7 [Glonium stellatum]|uniref:Nonribosomal peptide synthetase 7 n=1 Tax=Glonium stellatum TaxID=574774 RepID=A0A8E2FCN1_9PEZI|nr:nonribosomal peptide synthetase 7 [Glonium stellatum]
MTRNVDATISEQDRRTLIEQFNSTDDATTLGFCLPQLFEYAAERYPNNIAVISGSTELAYRTLNALANRLARVLVKERGVGRGDLVGVALDRSIDLIVSVLAVLKSGAAYVPIDPAFPAERITHMMNDAGPKLVIASDSTLAALSSWKEVCLSIDELRGKMENSDSSNPSTRDVQPEDLVYVIYTSGSTGRPKGVEANHGALCNLLLSMQREPGCDPEDRLLAVATVSFDMSILDLLLPLVSGATTVIAQTCELRDPGALLGLMERHGVTMIQATPSFWQMLLDGGWRGSPRLAKILTAGEPISRRLLDRLLAYADRVWNGYGPTEATVYSSVGMVSRDDRDIVIGNPIANFRLYVLHVEDQSPVPLGCLGELYIGGVGVNCGYRNNPELTRSRFLENNPFHKGRLYRSGDLARFIAPGKLSLVGRTDSQVKVRGYRIELGDISAAITEHKDVSAAVVVTREDQLVAYYVRDNKDNNDNNDEKNSQNKKYAASSLDRVLRPWLAERRPAYMMPAFFVEMDAFPMTLNGKIDRKALPDPAAATAGTRVITAEPQTEMERRVLAVWSRVLGHDCIGINDNFFQVGGNSLRVPRVKMELEKLLGRPVLTAKLFEHYTIKTLAAYLDRSEINGNTTTKYVHPSLDIQQQQQHCRFSLDDNKNSNGRNTRNDNNYEDIAIISMACRLPGGVTNPEQYWELLEKGGDGITDVPKNRWDADMLYDADPDAPGKSCCRRGGFIMDGIDSFDAPFFGISPREARTLEPTQHIMLETCWEGLERAGYTMQQLRGSQTGVFIGQTNVSAYNAARDLIDLDGYAVTGSIGAAISGRISYILGLEGPSLTVDTACSSSLVSTHLACTALRQGECDMAVAGGVTLMLSPGLHVEFSKLRGMSPDGSCRAFDADTQGTGFSEGSTAVVLKRLSDAQRDGDTIHAVLRGSAINHGGRRAASLTTPSGSAQERLIRTALVTSGLKPSEIDYIDAHGTATKLGDPIEGTALADIFGGRSPAQEPLWVGSVKSNIGHTQAAAGLASVLKVVLAMQHSMLPRTLHVTEPTPLVDWENANMALVLENRPWHPVNNKPRRAGVSSFGISGTNAHIIVEEAPSQTIIATRRENNLPLPPTVSFLVSGQTDVALRQQAEKLRRHIIDTISDNDNHYLGDLAYSLATTRNHFRRRLVLMGDNKADLLMKLASCSVDGPSELLPPAGVIRSSSSNSNEEPHLAMLLTGQGSQRLGMGKGLCEAYPPFREALEDVIAHFPDLGTPLLDVMWADPQSEAAALLHRTDFAQPAIFALEVALYRLWQSWGVQPQIVLGHSVGEIAAIHIAGVLDLSDACRLVAARGRLMQALASSRSGSMASLEANAAEITAAISALGLDGKVDIAGYNTPMQTVVSGDVDAVKGVTTHFARQLGRKVKMLEVSHAFHSFHMDDMLPAFRAVAETLRFNPPKLAVVSSLTGRLAEAGQLERPDYWVQQTRRAVRFSDSIQTLYHQQGVNMFLELGPQPVLSGMAAACLAADQQQDGNNDELPAFLPSLTTGKKDDISVVQRTLAELHVRHVPTDWPAYFKPFNCQRVELPTYAFQRERFYQRDPSRVMNGSLNSLNNHAATTNDQTNGVHLGGSSSERFEFEVDWHPVDRENVQLSGGSSWGLLCPGGDVAWASEAKMNLSRAGIRLTQVQQLQDAEQLDGLICLWDDSSDADVLRQAYHFTAEALAQLQAAARMSFAPPLVWVTRQAVGIRAHDGDANDNNKEKGLGTGPLWGLMRTARNEHPELRLRLIDVGEGKVALEALAPALMLAADEPECAVRHGRVLVPRIQRANVPKLVVEQRQSFLRQDGAVLITGGLGGIGKQVAKWLASTHQIHDLVLTSRRGMEAPGVEALVDELAQLGATATVVACDVGDLDSMKPVMAMFSNERPLRGVVHAAGVVDNGVLSAMTPERCATTFAPKVDGAWHLHQLTRHMDLDLFMMFSSISGVLGMPGLGNYAAANTFLDVLAHLRRAQHLPASSVAYGVWGGDGMATGLTGRTTLTHLAKFGLDPLTPEDGLKLFEQAVRSGRALTVAAALDPERLRSYLEEEAEGGEIPPLYRTLLRQREGGRSSSSSKAQKDGRGWNLRKALSEAAPEQHAAIVLTMVRETVAKALGFTSAEQVDVNVPLQDIGFDSLTAVLMRNQLANLTSLKTLSASSITWDYPNLRALSQFLLSQLQAQEDSLVSTPTTVGQPANGTTLATATSSLVTAAIKKGCLDPNFTFNNIGEVQRPESVFITGATGFVGAFILHELLELGIAAHCLVRADGIDHGKQRLVAALANYDLWKPDYAPLLNAVVGDAAQPLFGLAEAAFDELAGRVDAICHSGALVDWMRPLNDYIGPNVVSAHEVFRLASRGRGKAVHVVSTLATLPMHLGYEVPENDREYGYSTSKYMAERMVAAARWRGAKASVYRVPFVTASAATGHFRLDRGDFLHNLIAGSIEMGSFPSLDADLSVVQPVDYLCKTIVAVMVKDRSRIGHDFDFVNKYAVNCNHFFKLMMGAVAGGGNGHDLLPFPQWQQRALAYAAAHPTSSLARIAAVVDGLADESAAAAMLKGLPAGGQVFGGDVYPAPLVDEQLCHFFCQSRVTLY